MEEKSVLLNGGRYHEVVPLPDANAFLARILGGEPERPAISSLRSSQDDEGRQRVAVFIGTRMVGCLPADIDPGLLAAVKACELNEAVARARGSLLHSLEEPGKVTVRVDLADPDHLLSVPGAEPSIQSNEPKPEIETTPETRGEIASGPGAREEREPPPTSDSLQGAESSALASGYAEDYPEWPPPKPKADRAEQRLAGDEQPRAQESALGADPVIGTGALATVAAFGAAPTGLDPASTSPTGAPAPDLRGTAMKTPQAGAPSGPSTGQASSPSPDAVLATRSAWNGPLAGQSQAAQSGWLGSSTRSADQASVPQTNMEPGAPSGIGGTATKPMGQDSPAQSQMKPVDGAPNDLDSEILAAWGSPESSTQSVPQPIPTASKPHMNTSWVVPTVLAVLAVAIGLLVWKFVFAPKTYTDPEHGYSFSYPGRWEVFADSSMFSQFAYMLEGEEMPSMVMIGKNLNSNSVDNVAVLMVARAEVPAYLDRSQIPAQLQSQFNDAASSGLGFSAIEPVYPTTVGGVDGWKTTMSMGVGLYSMTISYCLLLDGSTMYVLMAAATGDAWDGNRKAFDRFFDSFDPG